MSALLWGVLVGAASAQVILAIRHARAVRRDKARARAALERMEEDSRMRAKAIADSYRISIEAQMQAAYMSYAQQLAEYEMRALQAEEILRAARRTGSIDSTAVELPERKRIH